MLQSLFERAIQTSMQPGLGGHHQWYPFSYMFGHLIRRAEFLVKDAAQLLGKTTLCLPPPPPPPSEVKPCTMHTRGAHKSALWKTVVLCCTFLSCIHIMAAHMMARFVDLDRTCYRTQMCKSVFQVCPYVVSQKTLHMVCPTAFLYHLQGHALCIQHPGMFVSRSGNYLWCGCRAGCGLAAS